MSDATSHEVLEFEAEEDEPLENVPPGIVRSGLESEDPIVRAHAARVAESVAAGDVDAILDVVPTVIERLEDDRRVVVTKSAIVVSIVAKDRPDVLEPGVPRLVEMLLHDLSLVRVLAAQTLGHVAVEHPEFLLGHEDLLIEAMLLEQREEVIDPAELAEQTNSETAFEVINQQNVDENARQMVARDAAANLLVEIAELEPDRLVPDSTRIADGLADENPTVVAACLDVLARIAREDPSAVAGITDEVVDQLDRPDTPTVASAVRTLGFAGDPDAIEPIRDVAGDDDRDEELRELAEETSDFIEHAAR